MAIKVLHITPHLGGGIGKVMSGLAKQSVETHHKNNVEHQFICLEQPEKFQFVDEINKINEEKVMICPSAQEQEFLINNADIIQLELFDSHGKKQENQQHRSSLIRYIKDLNSPLNNIPIRLIVWYHNNGLYDNFLPHELVEKSHIFLFASPCSFENQKLIKKFESKIKDKNLNAVFASGGFDKISASVSKGLNQYGKSYMVVGFFKHLNSAKIHPNIDEYLKCIPSHIKIKEFKEFVPNIIEELKSINVIAYLLNPLHYGCSENLLLESMAVGIVPIVLNNPAERHIVENGKTGLIVRNIDEFKFAIKYLYKNPQKRQKIGLNASRIVKERFSIEKTESELNYHYNRLLKNDKEKVNLSTI